jgi:hypothetical protein
MDVDTESKILGAFEQICAVDAQRQTEMIAKTMTQEMGYAAGFAIGLLYERWLVLAETWISSREMPPLPTDNISLAMEECKWAIESRELKDLPPLVPTENPNPERYGW